MIEYFSLSTLNFVPNKQIRSSGINKNFLSIRKIKKQTKVLNNCRYRGKVEPIMTTNMNIMRKKTVLGMRSFVKIWMESL